MSRKTIIAAVLIALVAVCLVLYFALLRPPSPKDGEKLIKIGVIQPLTGDLGNFGKTVVNGIEMAADDFSARNPSIKVKLYIEDCQAKPAVAVSALRKLKDVDGVDIVIGCLTSSATLAIAPIANESHILLMSPTASNPALSNAGRYFFRVWTSDTFDGMVAARYAYQKLGARNAAVLYLNDDYGVGLRDTFSQTFGELGGSVAVEDAYNEGETDFRSVLARIKVSGPDILYLPGHPAGIGTILRQLKELGIEMQTLSCVAAEDKEFLRLAGDAAYGLYFTAPAFDIGSERPEVRAFVSEYRRRFSEDPDTHAVHGYDALATILSGIEKGYVTPERLAGYLHELPGYEGLSGTFRFDAHGDVVTTVAVKKYEAGGAVAILDVVGPGD